MRGRYESFFDGGRNPEALKVAFAATDGGQLTTADFTRSVAETEAFNGWVGRMKARFREKPAPVGAPSARQAQKAPPARGAAARG
jgi:hypothetical protein